MNKEDLEWVNKIANYPVVEVPIPTFVISHGPDGTPYTTQSALRDIQDRIGGDRRRFIFDCQEDKIYD